MFSQYLGSTASKLRNSCPYPHNTPLLIRGEEEFQSCDDVKQRYCKNKILLSEVFFSTLFKSHIEFLHMWTTFVDQIWTTDQQLILIFWYIYQMIFLLVTLNNQHDWSILWIIYIWKLLCSHLKSQQVYWKVTNC